MTDRLSKWGAGALAALFISCGQRGQHVERATPPASPQRQPKAQPQQNDITIDLLVTANPVIVLGHARTFENALTVRALAADKSLLAEQHVVSTGEMGNSNPYRAELWLTRVPGAELNLEALAFSPKDGSVQSSAKRTARWDIPSTSIALVFPTQDCTKFDIFQREVPKAAAIARLMVEALVAGPTAEEKARGATGPIPAGSAVRSVILRNGVLTVDFNERLQNVGGSCPATAIRESVTRTLQRLPTVKKVVITAAGNERLALQP